MWVNPLNADMDATEIQNVLIAWDNAAKAGGGFYPALSAINPSTVTLDTLTGYQYKGGAKAAAQGVFTTTGLGTHTNAVTMPNQICAVLSLRTGIPGRSHRGRMYVPVLSVAIAAGGVASTTLLNGLASGLATSMGTFNSSGNGKCVVSSSTLAAAFQIKTVQVDNVLDTQRRRRDKVVGTVSSASVAA